MVSGIRAAEPALITDAAFMVLFFVCFIVRFLVQKEGLTALASVLWFARTSIGLVIMLSASINRDANSAIMTTGA